MYRRIALISLAGFVLAVGTAAPAAAQSPGTPSPDPAPAAVQHQNTAPKPAAPAPAPPATQTPTPAPVVSPPPPPAPVQSTPSPAKTTKPVVPKHKAAKTTAAKKAARAKPKPAETAPKHAVQAKKPAVSRPSLPAKAPPATSLPAEVPSAGNSGFGLSNGQVLMLAFAVSIGAVLLALLARAGWQRLSWWRLYHSYRRSVRRADTRRAAAVTAAVPPQPTGQVNGSDVAAVDDADTVGVVKGADAPTRT